MHDKKKLSELFVSFKELIVVGRYCVPGIRHNTFRDFSLDEQRSILAEIMMENTDFYFQLIEDTFAVIGEIAELKKQGDEPPFEEILKCLVYWMPKHLQGFCVMTHSLDDCAKRVMYCLKEKEEARDVIHIATLDYYLESGKLKKFFSQKRP